MLLEGILRATDDFEGFGKSRRTFRRDFESY